MAIPDISKIDFKGIELATPKKYPQFNILYGAGGTGKTTLAAHTEAPVIIPIGRETGHQAFANAGIPCFEPTADMNPVAFVFGAIARLLKTEHSRKTAIFDNLGCFREAVDEDVEADNKGEKLDAYGKRQALAYPYYTKLLAGFDALMKRKGMNVLLIGHSTPVNMNLPDGSYYQQISIHAPRGDNTNVQSLLEARAHNVLYIKSETQTKKTTGALGVEKTIAVRGVIKRTVYTKQSGLYFAKSRADLDDFYEISDKESIDKLWSDVHK